MKHALIVAHGQPSDPHPAEAALAQYAQMVQSQTNGLEVGSATLALPGQFEDALEDLHPAGVIYPLFMARGWFVTGALPKRMGAVSRTILDPLGTDPDLVTVASAALQHLCRDRGWEMADIDIVLAAHGSGRSRNPAKVANAFGQSLLDVAGAASVRVGFVEEDPTISHAARSLGHRSICLPFFACKGGHTTIDVPEALAVAKFAGPVTAVIGELPGASTLVARRISQHFESSGAIATVR
ncbi:MAG: CbiX/SirB N-terminal domain-containing protein [Pseudomonadota bacterium]